MKGLGNAFVALVLYQARNYFWCQDFSKVAHYLLAFPLLSLSISPSTSLPRLYNSLVAIAFAITFIIRIALPGQVCKSVSRALTLFDVKCRTWEVVLATKPWPVLNETTHVVTCRNYRLVARHVKLAKLM